MSVDAFPNPIPAADPFQQGTPLNPLQRLSGPPWPCPRQTRVAGKLLGLLGLFPSQQVQVICTQINSSNVLPVQTNNSWPFSLLSHCNWSLLQDCSVPSAPASLLLLSLHPATIQSPHHLFSTSGCFSPALGTGSTSSLWNPLEQSGFAPLCVLIIVYFPS